MGMFAKQSLDRATQKGPGFGAYLLGSLTEKLYTEKKDFGEMSPDIIISLWKSYFTYEKYNFACKKYKKLRDFR